MRAGEEGIGRPNSRMGCLRCSRPGWKAAMQLQHSSHQGTVVLSLTGRIDLAAAPQLQRAVLEHLAAQPPAIVCDLSQVEAIDPLCAGVFSSIRHPALGWPGTALVLCGAQPAVVEILMHQGVVALLRAIPRLAAGRAHSPATTA